MSANRDRRNVRLRRARRIQGVAIHLLLAAGAVIFAYPFYWMFVMASRQGLDAFRWPPPYTFGDGWVANYLGLVRDAPFWSSIRNSLLVATAHTALVLLLCTMAGYAFAMYRFPGRRPLFNLMLATMMVPPLATIIPWFIMMRWFGWQNNFLAFIIPGAANAFGILWMRQYIMSGVPPDLLDAARIDGCPEWQILFRVVAPLLTPALAALGIMTFMGSWNNFLGPLLLLTERHMMTVPVMISSLKGDARRGFDYGIMLMGSALATLPMLIAFIAMARKFMSGLTAGAVKQ